MERPSISEIAPGLFLGNKRCTYDEATLANNHITAVISAISGPLLLWGREKFTQHVTEGRHLWIECVDSTTQDLLVHMRQACDFIENMITTLPSRGESCSPSINGPPDGQDPKTTTQADAQLQPPLSNVLVHCDQGISRSSTIVTAYLMRRLRKSRDEILKEVRSRRPKVKPNDNFMVQLEIWEKVGYQIWEDEEKRIPKPEYNTFLERRRWS